MKSFLAATVVLLLAGATDQSIGNGKALTETRTVGGFTRVQNKTALTVKVTPGPTSVLVTADSNLLPFITTAVVDGGLVIDQTRDLTSSLPLSATVTTPTLTGIDDRGSGSLNATGFTAGDFRMDLAGSGTESFQGTVSALTLGLTGSGSMQLGGSASGLLATIDGSGSVDGTRFRVVGPTQLHLRGAGRASLALQGDSSLEMVGAGSLNLVLDGGTTDFAITGSGAINWSGQTTVRLVKVVGSGSVQHR